MGMENRSDSMTLMRRILIILTSFGANAIESYIRAVASVLISETNLHALFIMEGIPIRTEIIKFCESGGFDYMGAIIWQKVTTCHTTGGATVMGSYPYPRSGIIKLDYEFILIFKKYGESPKVSQK